MNKKIETINSNETQKNTLEPTPDLPTNLNIQDSPESTAEETSSESLKELQREVAEKEQKINQQLEFLWASGTKQMLGDHANQQTVFENIPKAPSQPIIEKSSPINTVQPTEQIPIKPETTIHAEQPEMLTQPTNNNNEHHNVPMLEENHQIVPTETNKTKKAKTTVKKKNNSSTKKKVKE